MRVLALAGALLAVATFAVGSDGPGGNYSLEQARAFDEFPLVHAGEEVDGLPLTAVLARDDTARYVSFVYGDCVPASEEGCAPPVEIQSWPSGRRGRASYGASRPGAPSLAETRIRGMPAALAAPTQLELYLPRTTVVVFADTGERLLAVAGALRCIDGGSRARDGPLDC